MSESLGYGFVVMSLLLNRNLTTVASKVLNIGPDMRNNCACPTCKSEKIKFLELGILRETPRFGVMVGTFLNFFNRFVHLRSIRKVEESWSVLKF